MATDTTTSPLTVVELELPTEEWDVVLARAAAEGLTPDEFIAKLLEAALEADSRSS